MPEWLQWSLIITGAIAIVVLLGFIRRQTVILSDNRKRQQKADAFQARRREDMIDSIRMIAMAIEENQVEYSEACLRIKGLLDHVEPALMEQAPYRVFLEVYEQLRHMPTHQARQDTEARFVEKMDKERFSVEKRHADEIRSAATAIRNHPF
ncbi:DUF2489 domain-containing protein [Marinobacter sp. ANT_B65]|uniref:DUF2489 domain-containing protein n=1 Tax=Marinobacter sp. ANT_B65 TaxID=2039467 RepID=UPI000BBE68AB|nr:DUF2489 domain-containing protein [Marinobacter sp. ANT_B65]PCM43112.1 hypothetical protein CPA50_16285 [Marinobacter sp. ANT_B65]